MSKKTETQTTTQFNQPALNNYNAFQGQGTAQGPFAQGLTNFAQNPLQSSFFQNQYNMQLAQNQRMGQSNMNSILNNFKTANSGGNMPGFQQSLLNSSARATSMNNSNSFNSTLMNAVQNQKWALNSMQGFSPLQTGQNTTQKTSGLGTWLPQLAGSAIQAGAAFASGGTSGGGGGFGLSNLSAPAMSTGFAGTAAGNSLIPGLVSGSSYWNPTSFANVGR